MQKFRLEINAEPKDIPDLDRSHKRDCADAVAKVINSVFKYTMFFSGGVMAYFGAYSLFSFTYMMRMQKMLPQFSLFIPLAALLTLLFEFIAGTMHKWAIAVEMALHLLILPVIAADVINGGYQSLIIAPFAVYGFYAHLKLITLIPFYEAISSQPGYPEFAPPLSKEDVAVKKQTEEAETAEETETATDMTEPAEEEETKE